MQNKKLSRIIFFFKNKLQQKIMKIKIQMYNAHSSINNVLNVVGARSLCITNVHVLPNKRKYDQIWILISRGLCFFSFFFR
jgi:hypothetical protein